MVLLVGLRIRAHKAITGAPANTGMQRTALCAHKIGPILKPSFVSTLVPIYHCAAADAQTVGPQSIGFGIQSQ